MQGICLGFDGSDSDDWTCIRAETFEGEMFTPTYGPDDRPTIWDPAEWGGQIPRLEVHAAVGELFTRYKVARMYCDPPWWLSEIEAWSLEHGEKVVVQWATYRSTQMHAACQRFVTDLTTGSLTHDDCPITALHIANARKAARTGDRYVLTKPAGEYHRKIDAAVTSVLAHEAACDARAAGWTPKRNSKMVVWN
jgi:hypothetical protein